MKLNEETVKEICEFIWRQKSFAFNNVYEYLLDVNFVFEPGNRSHSRLTLEKFALREYMKNKK